MRKPSASISVKAPTAPALPTATLAVRSKRAKTFTDIPTRASKRQRTQEKNAQPTCIECKKGNKADTLIKCIGICSNLIHRSCLPPQFGKKTGQIYECNDCQSCSICKKGFLDIAKLLKCYLCSTCFHSNCYRPNSGENIQMVKEKRFSCASCQRSQKASLPTKQNSTADRVVRSRPVALLETVAEIGDLETSGVGDFMGFTQSELVPPFPIRHSKSLNCLQSIQAELNSAHVNQNTIDAPNAANQNPNIIDDNNNVPDASQWTTNQIYEYFKKIFPRHAHVFEDEEIDGQALYRLQREDVRQFKIKIGPSIRIYDHILMMQQKRANQI